MVLRRLVFNGRLGAVRQGPAATAKRRPKQRGDAGFTLVEVIVALAIMAGAMGVLLNVLSNGLGQVSQAERMAVAGSLAQSLLAGAGTEIPLSEGLTVGQFENGIRWRLMAQPYGNSEDQQVWPTGAYTVSVEVSWEDGSRARSFTLSTLRLGPKAPRL